MIRHAKIDDVYEIANIKVSAWKKTYKNILDDSYLEKMDVDKYHKKYSLNFDESNYIIYEEDNKILGFCKYSIIDDKNYDAEIYSLYVKPDLIRKGIGTKMIDYVSSELKKKKVSKVIIWCLKDNKVGNNFYKKMGCVLKEEKKGCIDGINDSVFNGYLLEI